MSEPVVEIGAEYAAYRATLAAEGTRSPTEWTFKSHPDYQPILEHVSTAQGIAYLENLATFPHWGLRARTLLAATALANDAIGAPVRAEFDALGLNCSPTNLRYAWQAFTLWQHIQRLGLDKVHIIEIGGGYGGLALFATRFDRLLYNGTCGSYTILDIPEATAIQNSYISYMNMPGCHAVNGLDLDKIHSVIDTTQSGTRVLVSAYAFSEFSESVRNWYAKHIVPVCDHGFLVWNMIPVYKFTDKPLTIIPEEPLTGGGNKVVLY